SPAAPSSAAPAPDVANKARVPDDMRPIAQQASDAFSKGQFDAAADAYSKIVQKYPDSLYAWSNLGVVRFQQQRYPEAEKALKEAIRLNPNDAFSHSILGIVYYQQNRFDEAIDMLTRATTLDPNDARTRNYLGIACSQKGWQEAAEKQLRKAVEIDPSLGDAHFNLAVIYATQKPPSRELARKHYQKALDLGIPKDPQLEKFFSDTAADASAGSSGAAK
ncbi:MAG TPA: tetratricopeptide repeat protein, partial [Candidatus Methylacidiphilales bacterium]